MRVRRFHVPRGWAGRLLAAGLLIGLIGLAACGKKGEPEYPPGGEYPTSYPYE